MSFTLNKAGQGASRSDYQRSGVASSNTIASNLCFFDRCLDSKYYLYNVASRSVTRVSKLDFKTKLSSLNQKGTSRHLFVVDGQVFCGYGVGTKREMMSTIRSFMFAGESLEFVGEHILSSVFGACDIFNKFITSTIDSIKVVTDICKHKEFTALSFDIVSLLLSLNSTSVNSWNESFIISQLLRFYSMWIRGSRVMSGESLETLLMAAVTLGMPDSMMSILKRLSLFTSKRIFDAPGFFLDILCDISSFILGCVMQIDFLPEGVKSVFVSIFSFGCKKQVLTHIQNYLNVWSKDKRKLESEDWRKSVLQLYDAINKDLMLLDYFTTSNVAKLKFADFKRLVKSIRSYESCTRKEPVCIVLEGPPGTQKSYLLGKIAQVLGKSRYTHSIKSVDDGKDFHDAYNNEEVYILDDVGQQGISQWRTIINMVSTIKYPLDCAAADLKDTKFFNSEIMLLTTNRFSALTGLTKTDCISDIRALWRRGHVFNFDNVVVEDGVLSGFVKYMRFDTKANTFVDSFIPGCHIGCLNRCGVKNTHELVAWMTYIIERLLSFYASVYDEQTLSDNDVKYIRCIVRSHHNRDEYEDCIGESFSDVFEHYSSLFFDFILWCVSSLPSKIKSFASGISYDSLLANLFYGVASYFLTSFIAKMFESKKKSVVDGKFTVTDDWRNAFDCKVKRSLAVMHGQVTTVPDPKPTPTIITAVKDHMAVFEVQYYEDGELKSAVSQCLLSGHYILLVGHCAFKNDGVCNLYRNWDELANNNMMCNNIPIKVVYDNLSADIMILSLPREFISPFKLSKQFFKFFDKNTIVDPYFVASGGFRKISDILVSYPEDVVYRTSRNSTHLIRYGDHITYQNITAPGMCGSLIVDPFYGIVGFHVAAAPDVSVAIMLSDTIKNEILDVLNKESYCVDVVAKDVKDTDFSGAIFMGKLTKHVPNKSSLLPSPLHGVFHSTKAPVNLNAFGPSTVVKMAGKAYKQIPLIPSEEVDFAKKVMEVFIEDFDDISDYELVKGGDNLAPINKDSVNGIGFDGVKSDYFDFENGCLFPKFKDDVDKFASDVNDDKVDLEQVLMYETLKDELRLEHKVNKPRAFRVSNIIIQYWMKKTMGNLFRHVVKNRWFNQVMIGLNPYKDWEKIYDKLIKCSILFDGDVGQFDGRQAAQIQDMVKEVVDSHYIGAFPKVLRFVLEITVRAWIVTLREYRLTTHSTSSGLWVTGLFGSLYNRCYSACSYYRECKLNSVKCILSDFLELVDFVCGDDKLCGTKSGVLKDINGKSVSKSLLFNAFTMKKFFESINMEFTDGTKGEISSEGKPVEELSFLKRTFRYHTKIGRVMCPLSKETLLSSIMWFDSRKNMDVVLEGKIASFQREMYLHEIDGSLYVDHLERFAKDKNVPFTRLSIPYIRSLFIDEPDVAFQLHLRDTGKFYDVFIDDDLVKLQDKASVASQ